MDDHFANLSDGNTEKLQYREVKKPDISSSKTFVPTTIIRNTTDVRVELPWYNLCILHQGHKNHHWMSNKVAERKFYVLQ